MPKSASKAPSAAWCRCLTMPTPPRSRRAAAIADLPGVSKDRLGVRVTGDSLVIEGTALAPVSGKVELLYGEIHNPQYRRSFTLSRELDPGKIEAKLNNGVLRLRVPKAEEARPRRITVHAG